MATAHRLQMTGTGFAAECPCGLYKIPDIRYVPSGCRTVFMFDNEARAFFTGATPKKPSHRFEPPYRFCPPCCEEVPLHVVLAIKIA